MKFTGYRGPYEDGFPTGRIADDGSVWHEAAPKEIAQLPDDALVWFGKEGTEPRVKAHYAGYVLAGGYPYLAGIAALLPVYVRDDEQQEA